MTTAAINTAASQQPFQQDSSLSVATTTTTTLFNWLGKWNSAPPITSKPKHEMTSPSLTTMPINAHSVATTTSIDDTIAPLASNNRVTAITTTPAGLTKTRVAEKNTNTTKARLELTPTTSSQSLQAQGSLKTKRLAKRLGGPTSSLSYSQKKEMTLQTYLRPTMPNLADVHRETRLSVKDMLIAITAIENRTTQLFANGQVAFKRHDITTKAKPIMRAHTLVKQEEPLQQPHQQQQAKPKPNCSLSFFPSSSSSTTTTTTQQQKKTSTTNTVTASGRIEKTNMDVDDNEEMEDEYDAKEDEYDEEDSMIAPEDDENTMDVDDDNEAAEATPSSTKKRRLSYEDEEEAELAAAAAMVLNQVERKRRRYC
jgi:hypothetical protein